MPNEPYLIIGMALATLLTRYPPIALAERVEFPALIARALKYVPVAVLAAIIFPAILIPDGDSLNIGLNNPCLAGALVAAVVGGFSRSILMTILSGTGAFLAMKWLLGGAIS